MHKTVLCELDLTNGRCYYLVEFNFPTVGLKQGKLFYSWGPKVNVQTQLFLLTVFCHEHSRLLIILYKTHEATLIRQCCYQWH